MTAAFFLAIAFAVGALITVQVGTNIQLLDRRDAAFGARALTK